MSEQLSHIWGKMDHKHPGRPDQAGREERKMVARIHQCLLPLPHSTFFLCECLFDGGGGVDGFEGKGTQI